MKKIIPVFPFLFLFLFCYASNQDSAYDKILKSLQKYNVKSAKYITLLYYTPLNCISCNATVGQIFNNSAYKKILGENAFIIYPGIRQIEVDDYSKNLTEIGNIKLNYINDKELYDKSLEIVGIKNIQNSPPFLILFSPKNKNAYKIYIKDSNVLSKLDSILNLK